MLREVTKTLQCVRMYTVHQAMCECFFVLLWAAGAARLKRGSFTALLDNGVRLSYSVYGPSGGRIGGW